jgi:hypothetical protein
MEMIAVNYRSDSPIVNRPFVDFAHNPLQSMQKKAGKIFRPTRDALSKLPLGESFSGCG